MSDSRLMFLIDTDVCSYLLKEQSPAVANRLADLKQHEWGISIITHQELAFGASLPTVPARLKSNVALFLSEAKVFDFDKPASVAAAEVRLNLRALGKPSGAWDELIAGHAIALGATLVTNNLKHFEQVPGLSFESWL